MGKNKKHGLDIMLRGNVLLRKIIKSAINYIFRPYICRICMTKKHTNQPEILILDIEYN